MTDQLNPSMITQNLKTQQNDATFLLRIDHSTVIKELGRFRPCDDAGRCHYCRDWAQLIYKRHFTWTSRTQEDVLTAIGNSPRPISITTKENSRSVTTGVICARLDALSEIEAKSLTSPAFSTSSSSLINDLVLTVRDWIRLPAQMYGEQIENLFVTIEFDTFPHAVPMPADTADPTFLLNSIVIDKSGLMLPAKAYPLLHTITRAMLLSQVDPTCAHTKPEWESPTELETERAIFNAEIERVANRTRNEVKGELEPLWAPLDKFLAKFTSDNESLQEITDKGYSVDMETFTKLHQDEMMAFDTYWNAFTEKLKAAKPKGSKKSSKSEPVNNEKSVEEIDETFGKWFSGTTATINSLRAEFIEPRINRIRALAEQVWGDIIQTWDATITRIADEKITEFSTEALDIYQKALHDFKSADPLKFLEVHLEEFTKTFELWNDEIMNDIKTTQQAYNTESRPNVVGRLEKINNKEFRKRIKRIEHLFTTFKQNVMKLVKNNILPPTSFAELHMPLLSILMLEGEIREQQAIQNYHEDKFRQTEEKLDQLHDKIENRFKDGVTIGRRELAGILGKLFLEEALRHQQEQAALKKQEKLLREYGVTDSGLTNGKKKGRKNSTSSSIPIIPTLTSIPTLSKSLPIESPANNITDSENKKKKKKKKKSKATEGGAAEEDDEGDNNLISPMDNANAMAPSSPPLPPPSMPPSLEEGIRLEKKDEVFFTPQKLKVTKVDRTIDTPEVKTKIQSTSQPQRRESTSLDTKFPPLIAKKLAATPVQSQKQSMLPAGNDKIPLSAMSYMNSPTSAETLKPSNWTTSANEQKVSDSDSSSTTLQTASIMDIAPSSLKSHQNSESSPFPSDIHESSQEIQDDPDAGWGPPPAVKSTDWSNGDGWKDNWKDSSLSNDWSNGKNWEDLKNQPSSSSWDQLGQNKMNRNSIRTSTQSRNTSWGTKVNETQKDLIEIAPEFTSPPTTSAQQQYFDKAAEASTPQISVSLKSLVNNTYNISNPTTPSGPDYESRSQEELIAVIYNQNIENKRLMTMLISVQEEVVIMNKRFDDLVQQYKTEIEKYVQYIQILEHRATLYERERMGFSSPLLSNTMTMGHSVPFPQSLPLSNDSLPVGPTSRGPEQHTQPSTFIDHRTVPSVTSPPSPPPAAKQQTSNLNHTRTEDNFDGRDKSSSTYSGTTWNTKRGRQMRCGNCGNTGHSSIECTECCRYCQSRDHLSEACDKGVMGGW